MKQQIVRFPAFGGEAAVAATPPDAIEATLPAVEATVAEFDRGCSRFRDDSEISRLNSAAAGPAEATGQVTAAGRPVAVGRALFESLAESLRGARLTGGALDPTVGGALVAFGYDRDFNELVPGLPVKLAAVPGWRRVGLDREAMTVALPRGVRVDVGATAKALAADWAARRALDAVRAALGAAVEAGVLISFSGDLATAGAPPAGGWSVRVTDDHRSSPDAPGQTIRVSSGGLATSSTAVRRWRTADGEAHHLIDPHSGRPASGPWRTASVTAGSCVDANIASTAALIRGADAADWLRQLELPARLVSGNGRVLHVAGWPSDGDDLPAVELPGMPVPAPATAGGRAPLGAGA